MIPSAFLFNPSSGRGKSLKKRRKIESALKKQGLKYEWFTSKSQKHLKKLARSTARDFPVVVAVGGDTTFQIVAAEMLATGTSAAMGMLGTGSTNDITRCLGIQGPRHLCRAILTGETRWMDVGLLEIPGDKPIPFLGVLSLGMGVEVNRYMREFWSRHPVLRRGGNWVQTLAGIRGIRDTFRRGAVPSRIHIKNDGMEDWLDFSLIIFSNINSYAGGLRLTPHTNPFDGKIGCCILQSRNWRQTLSTAWLAQRGKHFDHPIVKVMSEPVFMLKSEDPIHVQYDGEVSHPTREFRISIRPAALKIVGGSFVSTK